MSKPKRSALGGKNKKILLTIATLGLLFSFGRIFAQQNNSEQPPNLGDLKTALVATVNIHDAKIVSQEGNSIKIGFDLSNQINSQPGVKYGINLVKAEGGKNKTLVDEKVYDENIYLGENFILSREIEYQAPAFFSGTYEVWIISKNEKGLRLSAARAGEISLNGDNQYLNQIQEQCYLAIKGDKENKKYRPDQGVDISSSETLLVTCPVKNNFSNAKEAFPVLTTFYRDSFGEKVSEKKENMLFFQAQEEKTLSFEIPTVSKPQAYDTKITFFNGQGEAISNSVKFHYVIQGESATFQNLTLDRDYYQAGDEARLNIFWSPSADSFPGSRISKNDSQKKNLSVLISNDQGVACADKYSVSIDSNQVEPKEYSLPIKKECVNPKIETTINDKSGKVLDQSTNKIETQSVENGRKVSEALKKEKAERMKRISLAVFVTFISIVFISLIIKIFAKGRRNIGKKMLFLLFLSSSFIFANNAHGDTFTIYGRRCSGSMYAVTMCKIFGGGVGISYTMNIGTNKSTYTPGETIAAEGSMPFVDACSNIATNAYLTGNINGSGDVGLYDGSVNSGNAINIYAPWFNAPGSGGNYNANFNLYINWDDPVTWGHMDGSLATSYKVGCKDSSYYAYWISNNTVNPGDHFTAVCNYGAYTNAIGFSTGAASSCNWTGWGSGYPGAVFDCIAKNKPGTYNANCKLYNIDPDHYCARSDSAGSITVLCSDSSWTFDTPRNEICAEQCAPQTSNCGNHRCTLPGTKNCNNAPTAHINLPEADATRFKNEDVEFEGYGTDPDGSIAAHRWYLDGQCTQDPVTLQYSCPGTPACKCVGDPMICTSGGAAISNCYFDPVTNRSSFSKKFSATGIHAVFYRVTDNDGKLSAPDIRNFTIANPQYALNVIINGSGTVASEDGLINCPGVCSHNYDEDSVVKLTATAGSGYEKGNPLWLINGSSGGNNNSRNITMNASKNVTANFVSTSCVSDGSECASNSNSYKTKRQNTCKGEMFQDKCGGYTCQCTQGDCKDCTSWREIGP
jgi:hypothetical protein